MISSPFRSSTLALLCFALSFTRHLVFLAFCFVLVLRSVLSFCSCSLLVYRCLVLLVITPLYLLCSARSALLLALSLACLLPRRVPFSAFLLYFASSVLIICFIPSTVGTLPHPLSPSFALSSFRTDCTNTAVPQIERSPLYFSNTTSPSSNLLSDGHRANNTFKPIYTDNLSDLEKLNKSLAVLLRSRVGDLVVDLDIEFSRVGRGLVAVEDSGDDGT